MRSQWKTKTVWMSQAAMMKNRMSPTNKIDLDLPYRKIYTDIQREGEKEVKMKVQIQDEES